MTVIMYRSQQHGRKVNELVRLSNDHGDAGDDA